MRGRGWKLAAPVLAALLLAGLVFASGWYGSGPLREERSFVVPDGASLAAVAAKLEQEGAIQSANRFRLQARILGHSVPIKAGEFMLPKGASPASAFRFPAGSPSLLL